LAEEVWIRPDVQELPLPRAVMSRLPAPSWWTLDVSWSWSRSRRCEVRAGSGVVDPLTAHAGAGRAEKSSLNTVLQPDGGPGRRRCGVRRDREQATTAVTRPGHDPEPAGEELRRTPSRGRSRWVTAARLDECGMTCGLSIGRLRRSAAPRRPGLSMGMGSVCRRVELDRKRFRDIADPHRLSLDGTGWEYVVADN